MNFNDLLKRMKKEENSSEEEPNNMNEIFDEFKHVNEARQNQKTEETEGTAPEAIIPEVTAEDKLKEEVALANDKFFRLVYPVQS